jgi:hypothetical protein
MSENRKSGTKRTSAPGAPGVQCNAGVPSLMRIENSIRDSRLFEVMGHL